MTSFRFKLKTIYKFKFKLNRTNFDLSYNHRKCKIRIFICTENLIDFIFTLHIRSEQKIEFFVGIKTRLQTLRLMIRNTYTRIYKL